MSIERELRDGLDACTSGPWSVDNYIITPGDIGDSWAVFETYEDDPPIIMCMEWQQEANARHIARCSPENIRSLLDELSRLREVERRARKTIREQAEELLWSAFSYGIQKDDRWWDGGLSDAEWLTRELELPSGWNDIAIVRRMIPGAAERIASRALSEREGQE